MSKQLPLNDFRAVRVVLEPDDFALGGDEPDPPPSDLISKEVWHGIMNLPDDVAIRTSDHNGKVIEDCYELWGDWLKAIGDPADPLSDPMLDSQDDLQTSIFDALHGYYRSAFSALRNILEVMTIGTCGAINKTQEYADWRNGSKQFKFGTACDQLSNMPSVNAFNTNMRGSGYQSLWDAKKGQLPGGYCRRLYWDLCNYAHSRPGFTDADLRMSNGPIYVDKAFWNWYCEYLRTISLSAVMMLLVGPDQKRSLFTEIFVEDASILPPDLLEARKLV